MNYMTTLTMDGVEVVTPDLDVESEFMVGNSRQPKGSLSFLYEESSQRKVNSRTLETEQTELVDILIPASLVFEVHARFENTLYGFFLGKAVAFPVVERRSTSSDSADELEDDNPISNTTECYACTQVGVPVFHSTSCDNANQPQWEASAGSSLVPIRDRPGSKIVPNRAASDGRSRRELQGNKNFFSRVYDPRSKQVQRWNRFFLLARGVALAVDPLFFYTLSIGRGGVTCLYMDGALAAVVAVLRTIVDAVHLLHMWLQFRVAYVSRESLVVGCGKLVWDPQSISSRYVRSLKGFWFDAFVILPVPQVNCLSFY
ncbi:hypothetical protein Tco_0289324 [Tanacetum coccineum]